MNFITESLMPWNYGITAGRLNESVLKEIGATRQLLTEVFNRTGCFFGRLVQEDVPETSVIEGKIGTKIVAAYL